MKAVKKEIHVLCVEDSPADVVLLNHVLRRGGLKFRSKRVDNRQTFLQEIKENPPDVILSDRGLPSFDGFAALALARDKCPDVPFIFVTGSLGERKAIETLKSGATDYVLKDELDRLVPAVSRALREVEERAALRENQRQLRESEERFRLLVEGVQDYAIVMLDPQGHITSWNPGAQTIHGYPAEEVLGHDSAMLYTRADQLRQWPRTVLNAAASQGRVQEEGWRLRRGGERFQANVVLTALPGEKGQLRGFAQVTRDITARKESEVQLRRSEERYQRLVEHCPDAIVVVQADGRVAFANQAAVKLFGVASKKELVGRPARRFLSQDLWPEAVRGFRQRRSGQSFSPFVEKELRRTDGTSCVVEFSTAPTTVHGEPAAEIIAHDISERRRAADELRQSEERFRMLVEEVHDYAIYMLDTAGHVITWSTGAEHLEGYRAEEILGRPFTTFFPPEDIQSDLPARLLRTAAAEGRTVNEGWRVRKDGSKFWSQGVITALRDEQGKLRGYSKIAHDITQQQQAAAEIRRLNEELEQRVRERTSQLEVANKELEAFSYSVSHDLRAPLRQIAGYVRLLELDAGPRLDEASRQHLDTIAASAKSLGDLIDALLAFSLMGRSELNRQPVNLAVLVEEARQELAHEAAGRQIDWQIGPLPVIQGDAIMFRQVVINLISNALKYTRTRERARIEIGATESAEETTVFIRDNGVGFDMEHADKLFGVFQRLHPASQFEGIGIGLANVSRIIRRHNGRVRAEGAVDGGATFYFSIPKKQGELT